MISMAAAGWQGLSPPPPGRCGAEAQVSAERRPPGWWLQVPVRALGVESLFFNV